jgi:DNA-binding MarR family transcriptional regulator
MSSPYITQLESFQTEPRSRQTKGAVRKSVVSRINPISARIASEYFLVGILPYCAWGNGAFNPADSSGQFQFVPISCNSFFDASSPAAGGFGPRHGLTTPIQWFRIEPMEPGRKTRLRVLRGHDEDNHGHSAVIAMVRIVRSLTEGMTRLAREQDLNLARLEVLLCLNDGEGISQQELSERLLVTKGNVCMTLQAMESDGLVERRSDPADQRAHRLYMTNAGRQRLAKTRPARDGLMAGTLGVLSADERRTLRKLLGRIEQTFDDVPDG